MLSPKKRKLFDAMFDTLVILNPGSSCNNVCMFYGGMCGGIHNIDFLVWAKERFGIQTSWGIGFKIRDHVWAEAERRRKRSHR